MTDPGPLTMQLHTKLFDRGYKRGDVYDTFMKSQRHICHLHRDVIVNLRNQPADSADLRMKFLLNHFDEDTFKRKLVLREKIVEKHAALMGCYDARVQMTIDIFQAYVRDQMDEQTLLTRLHGVHDMVVVFLEGIRKRFKCAVEYGPKPQITVIEREMASDKKKKQRVT
jgi:hypothetical protein